MKQPDLYYFDRGGRRNARLVRPFEKNLNLTIIGPTRILKIQDFGPAKVGVVGPAPPALFETIKMTSQALSNFVWRIRAVGEYSL